MPTITGKRKVSRGGRRRPAPDALTGRVRAHDPFELIRWLALSQPDPRKALAELVQNSLDARAQHIRVSRVREKGLPCLRIFDDGEGVIPEMADERPRAAPASSRPPSRPPRFPDRAAPRPPRLR